MALSEAVELQSEEELAIPNKTFDDSETDTSDEEHDIETEDEEYTSDDDSVKMGGNLFKLCLSLVIPMLRTVLFIREVVFFPLEVS